MLILGGLVKAGLHAHIWRAIGHWLAAQPMAVAYILATIALAFIVIPHH